MEWLSRYPLNMIAYWLDLFFFSLFQKVTLSLNCTFVKENDGDQMIGCKFHESQTISPHS